MKDIKLPEDLRNKHIHIDNSLKIKDYLKLFNKQNQNNENTPFSCILLILLLIFIIIYLLYINKRLIRCNVIRTI